MKILQIKINNLASLEGESLIDFTSEPLASAGIFAITGPTGAGKSTILDALCLALYGHTPRYAQAGARRGIELQDPSGETIQQGDPRSILRDGTAEGSATVVFVGIDGDHYEAVWGVRRAYLKVTGKLASYTHTLYNQTKNTEIPGTRKVLQKEIERLVGLSFEQFTRSVLLAQGDFTAFMKADKEEKSALLEKLTGSQIYSEISKNIYEHYKTEIELLKDLQSRASGIDLLSDEEIALVGQQIGAFKASELELTRQKAAVDQAVGWHKQQADLTASLGEAEGLYHEARKACDALEDTRRLLTQAQTVRPLKNTLDSTQEYENALNESERKKAALEEKLQTLTFQKKAAEEKLNTFNDALKACEKNLQDAAPLITAARGLDIKIATNKEQLEKTAASLQAAHASLQQLQSEKQQVNVRLEQYNKNLQSAQDWIHQREDRGIIAENTAHITGKLEQAGTILQHAANLKLQISGIREELQALREKMQTLSGQLTATEQQYQQHQLQFQQLQQKFTQSDPEALEAALKAAQTKERALEKSQLQFEQLQLKARDYEEAANLEADNDRQLVLLKNQQKSLQPALTSLTIQVETTRSLFAKAQLKANENIEQIRAALEDAEPCPVCGSLDHPYAQGAHRVVADELLSSLKSELDHATAQFESANKQYTLNESALNLREADKQRIRQAATKKHADFENIRLQWQSDLFYATLQDKAPDEILGWYEQEKKLLLDQIPQLEQQRSAHLILQKELTALQQTITKEKDSIQALKDAATLLKTSIQLKSQALDTHTAGHKEDEHKLSGLQNDLEIYFPSQDWFLNWQANPASFTDAIQKFAKDWKEKQKSVDQLSFDISNGITQLTGLDRQLSSAVLLFEEQQNTADKQQKELDHLLEQRKALFFGREIAEVEKELQEATQKARQEVETANVQLQQLVDGLTQLNLDMGILQHQIQQHQGQLLGLETKITDWIQGYNNTHDAATLDKDQVLTLLAYTDDWLKTHSEQVQAADQHLVETKGQWQQRQKDLSRHLTLEPEPDKRDLTALLQLQEQQQQTLDQIKTDLVERQLRLEINTKNQKKLAGFQKEISHQQKIFDGWHALNVMIGSKDGRRFREIAQQYTLDLLLRYANHHLQVLSKRYVLSRIQDSLGIQVIDQDMAGEIRSVYSLSGGESFLVSLALALGLASLSSQRLKVESLFIDEGFGSLDPATLSIAMDALERLQDQGRKVGVISHVQEMTERITVQIQVHKKSSGKSHISVAAL